MLKNIQVKINADNSITANYPYKIYQGEINKNRFVVDPSLIINDLTNVVGYIGFKRSDNQKSGFVPMEKQSDGTFLYVIKDYWTLNIPNKVWFTIKFVRTDSSNENVEIQIYSGNSSFNVNPLADYIIGDDIPPDASTILQNEIDTKLNKDFTTYEKLEWDEVDNDDLVILNKVEDGVVTPYYAEAKDLYTTVNDIHADEEGNIEITGSDIPVSETNTRNIEDELHLKVEYNTNQVITQPTVTVYSAEYAEKDNNGNVITQKYVAVDNNQNITGLKKLVRNVEYNTIKPTPNLKLQNNYLGNDGELSIYTDYNTDITMYSDRSDNIFSNSLEQRLQGYSTLVSNVPSKITAIKFNDDNISRVSLESNSLVEHKLLEASDLHKATLIYTGNSGTNLSLTSVSFTPNRYLVEISIDMLNTYSVFTSAVQNGQALTPAVLTRFYVDSSTNKLNCEQFNILMLFSSSSNICTVKRTHIVFEPTGGYTVDTNEEDVTKSIKVYALDI